MHLTRLNTLAEGVEEKVRRMMKDFNLYDDMLATAKSRSLFFPKQVIQHLRMKSREPSEASLGCLGRTRLHHLLDAGVSEPSIPESCEELDGLDIINQPNILGRCPIHIACHKATENEVKRLLVLGADVGRRTVFGRLPLHYAEARGSIPICRTILSTPGIDANVVDKLGATALHYAIRKRQSDLSVFLLSYSTVHPKSCDETHSDDVFWPPLIEEILQNDDFIVQNLLGAGADPRGSLQGRSAFYCVPTMTLLGNYRNILNMATVKGDKSI